LEDRYLAKKNLHCSILVCNIFHDWLDSKKLYRFIMDNETLHRNI